MPTESRPITAVGHRRPPTDEVLVDTAWLDEHLDDPLVRVVEVDVSPTVYASGHIAGAVLWNIYADLKDATYRLVDRGAVEQLMSRSGITADATVVFYGYAPTFGFWLMKLYGHSDVRVLNASRDTWQAERRPWNDQVTRPTATDYSLAEPDETLRATHQRVEQAIGDPSSTVIDVRTGEEFRGERFWPSGGLEPNGRAGHVPGSVHLEAEVRDPEGAFLPTEQLAVLHGSLDPSRELISYCTIGGRAATTWFVLSYLLGYPTVRVYDGSWAEWGLLPEVPVSAEPPVILLAAAADLRPTLSPDLDESTPKETR